MMPVFVHATDDSAATEKESVSQDVDSKLEEFLKVKDDTSISENDKEDIKAGLRKEILAGVLKLSFTEVDELRGQLEDLKDLNEKESEWKDSFLKDIETYSEYYKMTEEKTSEGVSVDTIRELKEWRDTTYTPRVKTIANFALSIQERSILRISSERYKKISADITKLNRGGYFNAEQFDELSKSLEESKKHIDNAHAKNESAYKLLTDILSKESATSTQSTTSTVATSTVKSTASATSTSAKASTSTPAVLTPNEKIANSIQESLDQIKSAYQIFLDMSQTVKDILGL